MRANTKSYILLFLFIFCSTANAQTIPYKQYGTEDGLGHSVVYSSFQDSKGFLWFCTDNGLSRFDGKEFINYTTHDGLPSNFIMSVAETDDSTLWIATYNKGIVKYCKGKFSPCHTRPNLPPKLIQLFADKEKQLLWITDEKNSIGYIDITNGSYTTLNLDDYISTNTFRHINGMYLTANGTILLATDEGAFSLKNKQITPLIPNSKAPVSTIDEDEAGNLWLGSDGEIVQITANKEIKRIDRKLTKGKNFKKIKAEGDIVWIINYPHDITAINSITGQIIYSDNIPATDVYTDTEKNIWIATFGHGIRCFNYPGITNYTVKEGLTDNIISAIVDDNNKGVWIINLRGINYIDSQTGKCLIKFEEDQQLYTATTDVKNNLIYGTVHSFVVTDNSSREKFFVESRINYLFRDVENKIWIATGLGVFYYKDDTIIRPPELAELNSKKIFNIIQDTQNKLWFGTDDGVYTYHEKKLTHTGVSQGIIHNNVRAVYENKSQSIWLATDAGVSSLMNGIWTNYSSATYMNNAMCTSIVADSSGKIWIGTNHGLFSFDGKGFRRFNQHSGLIGVEIQNLFIDSNDNLWVGTIKGLSKINLNLYAKALDSYTPPPVYIQNIKVNNRYVNLTSDSVPHFSHSENTIKLEFIGLFYRNPKELTYQYKLSGGNDIWNATSNNSIEFSSLPPGNYTFWVKAATANGIYSSPAIFSFKIIPPFWAKTGFIILEILFFIGIVSILFNWRLRVYKRKEREKYIIRKQLINLEYRALSALMNPHFIFNVLNSIQYYMKYIDSEKAHQYLKKFTRLIRLNFENAKMNYNTLENELSALTLYCSLEQLRFDKFNFQINITPDINTNNTFIPSLLIQPYVENAIWHGLMPQNKEGNLIVDICLNNNELIICITDDGIGIDVAKNKKQKKHKSSAIELTEQRLLVLEKLTGNRTSVKITNLSNLNPALSGTKVEILLPLLDESKLAKQIDV